MENSHTTISATRTLVRVIPPLVGIIIRYTRKRSWGQFRESRAIRMVASMDMNLISTMVAIKVCTIKFPRAWAPNVYLATSYITDTKAWRPRSQASIGSILHLPRSPIQGPRVFMYRPAHWILLQHQLQCEWRISWLVCWILQLVALDIVELSPSNSHLCSIVLDQDTKIILSTVGRFTALFCAALPSCDIEGPKWVCHTHTWLGCVEGRVTATTFFVLMEQNCSRRRRAPKHNTRKHPKQSINKQIDNSFPADILEAAIMVIGYIIWKRYDLADYYEVDKSQRDVWTRIRLAEKASRRMLYCYCPYLSTVINITSQSGDECSRLPSEWNSQRLQHIPSPPFTRREAFSPMFLSRKYYIVQSTRACNNNPHSLCFK